MKILKFTAPWCAPCKAMSVYWNDVVLDFEMIVESLEQGESIGDFEEAVAIDIDITEFTDITQQYDVRSVPTIIILDDNGVVVSNKTGALSESQLREWFTDDITSS